MQKMVTPEFEYFSSTIQLIPGLPDDVALNCLLRLPLSCRAVCKRWNAVLGNKERFFSLRKQMGFKDPWLFVIASHKCTKKIQCQVLDLTNMSWHTIPPIPSQDKLIKPYGLKCVSISIHHEDEDEALFVCGGWCDLVSKFEIRKNRWTVMNRMNTARSNFASGVINGMIYVAGGFDGDDFLDSAEVLDPSKGSWLPIATVRTKCMEIYDSAILHGKLLMITKSRSYYWPTNSFMVQVYDPTTNNWEISTAVGLRQGWNGKSAVLYGHLFVLFEVENGDQKIKVYKPDNDSWEVIQGPPLPNLITRPFVVNSCDKGISQSSCCCGLYLYLNPHQSNSKL